MNPEVLIVQMLRQHFVAHPPARVSAAQVQAFFTGPLVVQMARQVVTMLRQSSAPPSAAPERGELDQAIEGAPQAPSAPAQAAPAMQQVPPPIPPAAPIPVAESPVAVSPAAVAPGHLPLEPPLVPVTVSLSPSTTKLKHYPGQRVYQFPVLTGIYEALDEAGWRTIRDSRGSYVHALSPASFVGKEVRLPERAPDQADFRQWAEQVHAYFTAHPEQLARPKDQMSQPRFEKKLGTGHEWVYLAPHHYESRVVMQSVYGTGRQEQVHRYDLDARLHWSGPLFSVEARWPYQGGETQFDFGGGFQSHLIYPPASAAPASVGPAGLAAPAGTSPVTTGGVEIQTPGGRYLYVKAPKSETFRLWARSVGGDWSRRQSAWEMSASLLDLVRAQLTEIYGTDGTQVPAVRLRLDLTPEATDAMQTALTFKGRTTRVIHVGGEVVKRDGWGPWQLADARASFGPGSKYPFQSLTVESVPAALAAQLVQKWPRYVHIEAAS